MASLLRRKPIATLSSIFCRQQHRRCTFRSLRSGPPPPEVANVTFDVGGRPTSIETGKLALHANAAAVISVGGTRVLATVDCTRSDHPLDSLPLKVDYEERTPWEKDQEHEERKIICSHLIQRVIRPCFPAGFYHGIQVTATVLSSDGIYNPDVMAAYATNAASAALMLSDIPWNGPVGVIVAAKIGGEFVFNPTIDEIRCSDLNLLYARTKDRIVMVDGYGREPLETGFTLAHSEALKYIGPQIRLAEEVGRKKGVYKLSMVSDRTLQNTGSTAEGPIKTVFTNSTCGKVCLSQEKPEAEDYERNSSDAAA